MISELQLNSDGQICVRGKYIFTVKQGFPCSSDKFSSEEGIPVVRIRDITSGTTETMYSGAFDERFLIDTNSFLIGMDGDFNVRWWNNGLALLNQRCCEILTSTCSKKYLYYVLPFYLKPINDMMYFTTVKHLSVSDLYNQEFLIPSLPVQSAIANYLDSRCAQIDSMIASAKANIEDYKALKQSVITQAVTKGLEPNVEMKDSGYNWIKELPFHWAQIPSKYLFRNSDTRKQKDDIQLTSSQKHGIISQEEYMRRENAKVVLADKNLENWKHVEPMDFVISLRSFQGGLEMSETTGCITWHYVVLKPCKPIFPKYFKYLFKCAPYVKALQNTCNFIRDGQDLRYSNFSKVPLFFPPIAEQLQIATYLDTRCAQIDQLVAEQQSLIDDLEAAKKSLIYECVTGKRRVPDIKE